MTAEHPREFVAECFWAGVSEADLRALDERVASVVADLVAAGEHVGYVGSLLIRADEVVLCVFEGAEQAVRTAAERAHIPFERILEAARSPWPAVVPPTP